MTIVPDLSRRIKEGLPGLASGSKRAPALGDLCAQVVVRPRSAGNAEIDTLPRETNFFRRAPLILRNVMSTSVLYFRNPCQHRLNRVKLVPTELHHRSEVCHELNCEGATDWNQRLCACSNPPIGTVPIFTVCVPKLPPWQRCTRI